MMKTGQGIVKSKSQPKFHICTYGCQMNEHDSEQMAGLLSSEGYSWADNLEQADIILINSCTIRWKAEEKAFSQAGRLKRLKKFNPNLKIGFCGCVAQREREEIFKRAPHIDFVFGTLNIQSLPCLVKKLCNEEKHICAVLDHPLNRDNNSCFPLRTDRVKAWITIMEGCNNFCSYCVVPYVRGRERSRKPEEIMKEAAFLARSGYKEITLLGQNVNSYGKDLTPPLNFSDLLLRINTIQGIDRIRFVTSHPKDLSMDLIYTIKECKNVCEHIHLPLQSGADRILKRMGRGYTLTEYMDKVKTLKALIPGISITGDVICGFPGETEQEFEQTLKVIEETKFDGLFAFKYSSRPQTVASQMSGQVPEEAKIMRLHRLQMLQNQICTEINSKMFNIMTPVLIEGVSKKNPDKLTGRTRTNKIVNIPGSSDLIGKIVMVKIIHTKRFDLEGLIV